MIDLLSTDRLAALPQEPASGIWIGARVECSRQGEWIPGTIVGLPDQIDRDRPLEIQVDLDRPDRAGSTAIWTDSHKIRLLAETAAAADRYCARELDDIADGIAEMKKLMAAE